jgi:uncharacterized membrane protein
MAGRLNRLQRVVKETDVREEVDASWRGFGSRALWGAALLGIALGGLFDGILLHQVLQWHHLLSLVGNESLQDIRVQILADGLFHILMYTVACVGLWLLWSARRSEAAPTPSSLLGTVLLGFGLWQVIDVVLFHWIVRIHRIRVDVTYPIWWDIGWMVVFGAPALALAWWLTRTGRAGRQGTWPTGVAAIVTGIMFLAGAISFVPAAGTNTVVAVFSDKVTSREAFSSIAKSGAEIVWVHESGLVAALRLGRDASRAPLYQAGATLVSGAVSPCAVQAEARI